MWTVLSLIYRHYCRISLLTMRKLHLGAAG